MYSLLLVISLAEAKKPKGPPPPPPTGWVQQTGWTAHCYYPVDFSKLGEGDRRIQRQTTLEAMKSQWSGSREDGISFDADAIESVDTVLLGLPSKIEAVAAANRDKCVEAMTSGNSANWAAWVKTLDRSLMAGECVKPLDYTMFDYLEITSGWQREVSMCKGNKAHIIATTRDRYRISASGPWINADGDPAILATGPDWPCNMEGCFGGMLIGRFTSESGVVTIFPIGVEKWYTAPENGVLSWQINDSTWYDNTWFKTATIEDRTAVTVSSE